MRRDVTRYRGVPSESYAATKLSVSKPNGFHRKAKAASTAGVAAGYPELNRFPIDAL